MTLPTTFHQLTFTTSQNLQTCGSYQRDSLLTVGFKGFGIDIPSPHNKIRWGLFPDCKFAYKKPSQKAYAQSDDDWHVLHFILPVVIAIIKKFRLLFGQMILDDGIKLVLRFLDRFGRVKSSKEIVTRLIVLCQLFGHLYKNWKIVLRSQDRPHLESRARHDRRD